MAYQNVPIQIFAERQTERGPERVPSDELLALMRGCTDGLDGLEKQRSCVKAIKVMPHGTSIGQFLYKLRIVIGITHDEETERLEDIWTKPLPSDLLCNLINCKIQILVREMVRAEIKAHEARAQQWKAMLPQVPATE